MAAIAAWLNSQEEKWIFTAKLVLKQEIQSHLVQVRTQDFSHSCH